MSIGTHPNITNHQTTAFYTRLTMSPEPPTKKLKRSEYRETKRKAFDDPEDAAKLPKKKFYRQRAHANPFSDHQLT